MVPRPTIRAGPVTKLTSRFALESGSARRLDLPRLMFSLAVAAVSLSTASVALAELDLRWNAPRGCPQRQDVLEKIRAIAGSALDESEALSVEGNITREARTARLELLVRDGERRERREIASESCSALAGAAAVTLALLLGVGNGEPSASDEPASSDPNASGTTEQGASSVVAAEPRAQTGDSGAESDAARAENIEGDRNVAGGRSTGIALSPPRDWAIVVRAPILAADMGPLPQPALGIGLGVGLRFRAWALLLGAQLSREQSISSGLAQEGSGADLQRATGQLLMCRGWRWGSVEASPCLGLSVEHVTARGFGDGVSPQPRRALWPAPGVAAALHWHTLESLAFFVSVSAHLELSRPRLLIQDLGEVRQLGPATLGASVGLEWIL